MGLVRNVTVSDVEGINQIMSLIYRTTYLYIYHNKCYEFYRTWGFSLLFKANCVAVVFIFECKVIKKNIYLRAEKISGWAE